MNLFIKIVKNFKMFIVNHFSMYKYVHVNLKKKFLKKRKEKISRACQLPTHLTSLKHYFWF